MAPEESNRERGGREGEERERVLGRREGRELSAYCPHLTKEGGGGWRTAPLASS